MAFVLISFPGMRAIGQIVSFNQISQEHGLRNGNVRAIIKDHQGFVWIGTEDGLHRYDGYSMKIYRKDENDTTTISSNFILCLFEDSQHNLWVGTLDGSLCLYNREKDNFIHFAKQISRNDTRINEAIRVIYEDEDQHLFIGSGKLLRTNVSADPAAMQFRHVGLPTDTITMAGLRIMDISPYSDSLLLMCVNNIGLFYYNRYTDKLTEHPISRIEKNVQNIYTDTKRKLLWLGTWKNGLLICNYSGENIKRIQKGTDQHTLRNDYVPALVADSIGNVWIATDHGLSMIPHTYSSLSAVPAVNTYLPDNKNSASIHGSIIKTLYIDPQDNLWVGAYYSGISLYDKRATHFGTIIIPPTEKTASADFLRVSALIEEHAGKSWIGTDGGGLYYTTDSIGNTTPSFQHVNSCEGIEKIRCMALDGKKNLWIGTWGRGLYVFHTETNTCSNFESLHSKTDIGKEVISLATDLSGDVWIGTFDKGLFRYMPGKNNVVKMKHAEKSSVFIDRINVIHIGKDNTVWIGREAGGLHRTIPGSDEYHSVVTEHVKESSTISSLYSDQDDRIWIGCPNKGLVMYDSKKHTSDVYTEQDGLANSMIYGIQEDRRGSLWISTDMGISVFDKTNGRFSNFSLANGLLTNQFNRSCIMTSSNGYLVFGNIKGINYINPEEFHVHDVKNPIVFTRLSVNNKEQLVGKPGSILTKNVSLISELELDHDQNSFSVEVASLDFNFTHPPEYYYKLEGYNDTWQYAGTRQLIQYTNINPGNYVLKVSTTDNADEKNVPMATISVVIHKAWWQTIFFKAGLFLFIILGLIVAHRIRVQFLVQQRRLLENEVQFRTQKLNDTLDEVQAINDMLKTQKEEIIEKNNEILAQNEELYAQNDHIQEQHEKLTAAQQQLKEINVKLEKIVDERTETLQETVDHLNKVVFELDRFVYSASHDLGAPLKSILGLVNVINMERNPDNVIAYVGLIRASVLKLDAVIKSMVDYARNSHVQVNIERFNLYELMEEVYRELGHIPEAAKITFYNLVPAGLTVQSDRMRFKIIFTNLISNCMKYLDTKKDTNWVKIEAVSKNAVTQINVSDNGIGIHEEYVDKIFNMFFRATEVSKGSGLGLFIVKETVQKIGGRIMALSNYGMGTIFEVTVSDIAVDNGRVKESSEA
ncbi:MAG TPA: two-component regulator propeller domain-containing protein [Ohtaekwangia sp.]